MGYRAKAPETRIVPSGSITLFSCRGASGCSPEESVFGSFTQPEKAVIMDSNINNIKIDFIFMNSTSEKLKYFFAFAKNRKTVDNFAFVNYS
jgi:hypothetical protein